MECPNCGAKLKPGAKVCLNCGYYLNDDDKKNDDTFGDDLESDDEYIEDNTSTKKFDINGNIIYIVLGVILIFSLILLIYGIATRNRHTTSTNTTSPTSTPEVQEKDKRVEVDGFSVTVPAGFDYQVESNSIFISDEDNYNFSFRINDANYDKYSADMQSLGSSLTKQGYNITYMNKKSSDSKELLVYTLSIDNEVKYLYLTKYDSTRTAMGIITINNTKTSLDDICSVIVKVTNSVDMNSTDSSDVEDSSGTSIVEAFKRILELNK